MKKFLVLVAAVCMAYTTAFAQTVKPFKEGDRAVFLGNSITDGGRYHSFIWLYYMTRFPNMPIRVFNGGIGGDTAYDMNKRLDGDIFSKNPTVLMVTFGMNDSGYYEYNGDNAKEFGEQKYQESIKNFQQMEKRFKELPHTRIVMTGTSPYDETAQIKDNTVFKKKNETIKRIIEYQRESAARNGWEFTDWNAPMVAINQELQQKDPSFTLCGNDRIHPDNDGHMVMAYLFLKAQGLAGKLVADIRIDGAGKKVTRSDNCRVSDLSVSSDNLTFTYEAKSLPYPIDTSYYDNEKHTQADALSVIPFMDEMNYEGLSVSGLSDGYYGLTIGGEFIGRFTARELERGINMALLQNTPQYKQAMKIRQMNEERWLKERKMREFYWVEYNLMRKTGMLWACNEAAVDTLRKYRPHDIFLQWNGDLWLQYMHKGIREDCVNEQQDLVNQIYEQNKPIPLRIEIKKFTDL